jgi:phosphatidylglycerophosphate synthase
MFSSEEYPAGDIPVEKDDRCLSNHYPRKVVLDNRQAYKRLERDAIIRTVYWCCEWLTVHCCPRWLSPIVIGVPGVIAQLAVLVLLFTLPLQPWMYGAWSAAKMLHFCLDIVDGEHARQTGTQSPARHFWDHALDMVGLVLSTVANVILTPHSGLLAFAPPSYLLLSSGIGMYTGFVCYHCTGIMIVPYSAHAWNYVYNVFLCQAVVIYGLDILKNDSFLLVFATLTALVMILALVNVAEFIVRILFSASSPVLFLGRTMFAPLSVGGLHFVLSSLGAHGLLFNFLFAFVIASFVIDVHARQMMDHPPAIATVECLELLPLLLGIVWPTVFWSSACLGTLLIVCVTSLTARTLKFIRILVSLRPDIGFPFFVIPQRRSGSSDDVVPPVTQTSDLEVVDGAHVCDGFAALSSETP